MDNYYAEQYRLLIEIIKDTTKIDLLLSASMKLGELNTNYSDDWEDISESQAQLIAQLQIQVTNELYFHPLTKGLKNETP